MVLSAQWLTNSFAHGLYSRASWAASVYRLGFWKLNIKRLWSYNVIVRTESSLISPCPFYISLLTTAAVCLWDLMGNMHMAIVDPKVKPVSQGLNLLTLCWCPFLHSSSSVLEVLSYWWLVIFCPVLDQRTQAKLFNKDVKWAHLGGKFGSTNLLQEITYVFLEIVF